MSTALTITSDAPRAVAAPVRTGLLRAVAPPTEVLEAQNETREMIARTLVEGRDFGIIPGTGKKNRDGVEEGKRVLLKPGSERLCTAFGLAPSFAIVEKEIDHDRRTLHVKREKIWRNQFKGDRHFEWGAATETEAFGLYRYVIECTLTQRDTGAIIASAVGSCSTLESKYCDRPRDLENTILKMASKRAQVAATLLALGLSDQFTQDIDETMPTESRAEESSAQGSSDAGDKWNQPRPAEPLPPQTAALAAEMTLPGGPAAFGGKGGHALGTLKPKMLATVAKWIDGDAERLEKFGRLRNACALLIASHDANEKAREAAVAVGAEDATPVATPAPALTAPVESPVRVVDMQTTGPHDDDPHAHPALTRDDDDKLPF